MQCEPHNDADACAGHAHHCTSAFYQRILPAHFTSAFYQCMYFMHVQGLCTPLHLSQVVAVLDPSPLRSRVVGVLRVQPPPGQAGQAVLQLVANDPRLPACAVAPGTLPAEQREVLMQEAEDGAKDIRTLVQGAIAGARELFSGHG